MNENEAMLDGSLKNIRENTIMLIKFTHDLVFETPQIGLHQVARFVCVPFPALLCLCKKAPLRKRTPFRVVGGRGRLRSTPCRRASGRSPSASPATRRVVAGPIFGKISANCCSFLAVSAPIFAKKNAFCSIFQNLPDYLAEIFEIWQNLQILRVCKTFLLKFHENCWFFLKPIFCENFEIAAVQKDTNLVELEKCCRTHIFLQNFVLIQPRTSPPKICKILLILKISKKLEQNIARGPSSEVHVVRTVERAD